MNASTNTAAPSEITDLQSSIVNHKSPPLDPLVPRQFPVTFLTPLAAPCSRPHVVAPSCAPVVPLSFHALQYLREDDVFQSFSARVLRALEAFAS